MASLSQKMKDVWFRCVNDGLAAGSDHETTKRVRLFNSIRFPTIAILISLAIANFWIGARLAAAMDLFAALLGGVAGIALHRGKIRLAKNISITGLCGLVLGMTIIYGDTVFSHYNTFPLISAVVILYRGNQKYILATTIAIVAVMAAAMAFGYLIFTPIPYPVPMREAQLADFVISAVMTAFSFYWLKQENARVEQTIRADQKWLKKLNQELTAAQQVLEKRAEQMIHHSKMTALGEMGSGMAHEINNPLTVAMGNLQLIIAEAGKESPSNERVIKYATMALEYNKRIQTVVKALRHYSSDWEDSPLEDSDLQLILQETSSLIGTRFRESGTDLLISTGTQPIMINCRSAQISQAILALLFNSFEATKNLPDRWINVMVEETATDVKINVIDSGAGIPKNIQDKLMQPFFTTKDVGQGKGLGLSTARAIIAQHKGTIQYDPTSPNTCFVITLPKAGQDSAERAG